MISTNLTTEELQYLGGLCDGRLMYAIVRKQSKEKVFPDYIYYLEMVNTDDEVIAFLRERVGGNTRLIQTEPRIQYKWVIEEKDSLKLLEVLNPYMKGKKLLRDLYMEIIRFKNNNLVRGRECTMEVRYVLEEYAALFKMVKGGLNKMEAPIREFLLERHHLTQETNARIRYKFLNVENQERFS